VQRHPNGSEGPPRGGPSAFRGTTAGRATFTEGREAREERAGPDRCIPRPGDCRPSGYADTQGIEARANIRSFLTAALVCLAVLVFAASAGAKGGPPAGKGGPPPWAGGGNSAKLHSGKGAAKRTEQAARKAERAVKAAKKADKAREGGELNPAMTCFGLLAEMGEEFYAHYGTNPNQANAFGKCVSEHAKTTADEGDDEAEEPADCDAPEEEPFEPPVDSTLDGADEATEGEEPAEGDCAPAEEQPGECEEPGEEEPTEDAPADLTSSDDPATGDECPLAEEEPGEPDDGGPDETDAAAPLALTCFLPAPRANPFALCL